MARGRGRRDPAKEKLWRERIAQQENSGLSVREFCLREGISEPSMYCWRREIARRDAENSPAIGSPFRRNRAPAGGNRYSPDYQRVASRDPSPVSAFLPVHVIGASAFGENPRGHFLEIVLPTHLRILVHAGFDPALLRQVVETLGVPAGIGPC